MKEKYFNFALPFIWFLLLVFSVFLFAFTSHAEDSYFPMSQNENDHFSSSMLSAIDSQFDSENNYTFVYTYSFAYGEFYCYALYFSKNDSEPFIFGEINNDGNAFSLYPLQNVTLMKFSINPNTNVIRTYPTAGTNAGNYQNLPSSQYNSNYGYVSNFKIYTNNSKTDVVLKYGSDDPLPGVQGHATPPEPFDSPTLATGSNYTLPREVPESPTIINYSWTTYNSPSIDNSTVESLLESLIDVVKYNMGYFITNVSNEFDNLITNIKGYFDFVSKTIQYYGGLIISNIQNGIDTFYNNMVSLIEPIYEKFDYFTEDVDVDVINTAFVNTSFYSVKTQFTSVFTTFDNAFDIAEPDSFTIIFNIQNITLFYDFGVRSPVTVDLGSNFLPIRAALRTFLWVLVSFGSVFVVEHGLANWLRGERNS